MKELIQKIPIGGFFQYPFGRAIYQLLQRMDVDGKTVIYYLTKRGGKPHRKQFDEDYTVHFYKDKKDW